MSNPSEATVGIQYHDMEHQKETALAGMWLFLATEVMFFGGVMAAYVTYWYMYPEVWREFSHHLKVLYGSMNTLILLTSSLLVALAVHESHQGRNRRVAWLLWVTAILGTIFLGIKFFEWSLEFREGFYPGAWSLQAESLETGLKEEGKLYFSLYFALTGLHALHVFIGVVLLAIIGLRAIRGRYTTQYNSPVEISGLYWHFVDVIWIFLFPMLYLVDRAS